MPFMKKAKDLDNNASSNTWEELLTDAKHSKVQLTNKKG